MVLHLYMVFLSQYVRVLVCHERFTFVLIRSSLTHLSITLIDCPSLPFLACM